MSRRTVWVSIRRQKRHEMWRTIRLLHPNFEHRLPLLGRLAELQTAGTVLFGKLLTSVFILFLALQGANETGIIQISFSGYSASIDGVWVAILGSAAVFLSVVEIQKWFVLQELRDEISNRYRIPGFNPRIALFLNGHEESTPAIPMLPFSFLKERLPISKITTFLTIIVVLGVLAPLPYMAITLFGVGWNRLELSAGVTWANFQSITLLLFLAASPLFLILSNLPIPMEKDVEGIRWGFLFPYGKYKVHPQTEEWLENE